MAACTPPVPGSQCLVGHVLSLMRVADEDLEELRDHDVRRLYREGRLPVRLTLGALAVLDAAQRSQDRGYAWGDALEYATSVATDFPDLLPDVALQAVGGSCQPTASTPQLPA